MIPNVNDGLVVLPLKRPEKAYIREYSAKETSSSG